MNKIKTTLLMSIIFFGLFFVFNTTRAELIEEFNSTISIYTDSSILIEENITYNFEGAQKHGIFRTIPLKNSQNEPIIIKNIYISDNEGNRYNFTENTSNEELTIKIGDEDRLVTGIKNYHIAYRVLGVIGYYEDYDEVYWNVTGNDWMVPIKTQTRVFFPEGTEMKNLKNDCYVGIYGSTLPCQINLIYSNGVSFVYDNILNTGEEMTISTGFDKNIVDMYIQPKTNYTIVFLPIIIFIISYLIWRKHGKDPKGYSTVIVQYEPPKDVKPTLASVIMSEFRDYTYDQGIIAGIVYLAQQGFIKIYKIDKKWLFGNIDCQIELIKDDFSTLGKIEVAILNLFFDKLILGEKVMFSELDSSKRDFMNKLDFLFKFDSFTKEINQEIKKRGFVDEKSSKLQLKYFLMSFPVIIISGLIITSKGQASTLEVFSMIISLCIFMFFGVIMGKKTKQGSETKDHLLGFKKFLSVVEKERLDFHNAPEKNPEKFMEFLPYAIALGVEGKWAKYFAEISNQKPSWYIGGDSGSLNATDFTSDISQFSKSFSSILKSSKSSRGGSGGGGSSGGGGGGGGGGSW